MMDANDALLDAFSLVLRRRRLACGLSQEELAHRAGVSMRYVSLLEGRRHQPTLSTINGLCRGLDLTMKELIGDVEQALHGQENS